MRAGAILGGDGWFRIFNSRNYLNRHNTSCFGWKKGTVNPEKVAITQHLNTHWDLGNEYMDQVIDETRLLVKKMGPEGILLAEDAVMWP